MKKRLYLVQVNQRYGENVYVPYSVGCLWAYARTNPAIADAYEMCGFLYVKEPIEQAVARLQDPDLIGVSHYIWNAEWNKAFVAAVKARWPRCVVVVGGVHVWDENTKTLDENPDFDFAVYGEGEGAFAAFLIEHTKAEPDYATCDSLVWRTHDKTIANKRAAFTKLDALPSPYLSGVFDPILAQEKRWQVLQESHRGCPFACTFCVAFDTMVETPAGLKPIADVRGGDFVLGMGEASRKLVWNRVEAAIQRPPTSMLCVGAGELVVELTDDHQVYTRKGWVAARDVKVGTELLQGDSAVRWVKVTSVSARPAVPVVDLVNLSPFPNFFANGILVHNCAWGVAALTKVRPFPEERVVGEFQWFGEHQADYLDNADANYAILKRDMALTQALVETNKKYGFPKTFRTSFTKNSNDTVWNVANLLHQAGMLKAVTLAMQSMDQGVLTSIKRKNIKFDHFGELIKKYEAAGIPTYTELIMGLPGESLDAYIDGIERNLVAGQHNGLFMYLNIMLPNTEQNTPAYVARYGLRSTTMLAMLTHGTPDPTVIQEKQDIVTETAAMPHSDWVQAYRYSKTIEVFHSQGLLQHAAIVCHVRHGMPYRAFYRLLMTWLEANEGTIASQEMMGVQAVLQRALAGGSWDCVDHRLGNISWPPEEFAFARICLQLDQFYAEIKSFFDLLPEPGLWEEQRQMICGPELGKEPEWARDCVWYGRKGYGAKMRKKT